MFVAQKPCSFAGQDFKIGDTIPDGLVLPEAVTRLTKGGFIAEVVNAGPLLPASTSIEVPVLADEGETTVTMTQSELLNAIRTIQKTDDEIINDIQSIENEEVLIFIDVMKGAQENIHMAAKERATAITVSEEQKAPISEHELMRMKRDELAEIATGYGMTVAEEDTKKVLATFILEAQGSEA